MIDDLSGAAVLYGYDTVFWDFDGVIKDSVGVKSDAFERLFAPFGAQLAARVRAHHECNGGLSRYQKLPLYLEWALGEGSDKEVERYCGLFAVAVRDAVIASSWVPGAREYLEANYRRQRFVVVTATPQAEIEDILCAVGGEHWFRDVRGAPAAKADSIGAVLTRWKCPQAAGLLVGDSDSDYEAARATGVEFLLRRTPLNVKLQRIHRGPQCLDFVHG